MIATPVPPEYPEGYDGDVMVLSRLANLEQSSATRNPSPKMASQPSDAQRFFDPNAPAGVAERNGPSGAAQAFHEGRAPS